MKTMARLPALAAALIIPAIPMAPALADESAESAAVWQRHVARATAGDLNAVMEDFAEDSVVITATGVVAGKAAIRTFFKDFLAGFDKAAIESMVVNTKTIHDDVVVFNFTVGTAQRTFQDTAVIRDDHIKVLATVGYPAK